MVELGLSHRHLVVAHTVNVVSHADRDLIQAGQNVQLGDEQVGETVDAHSLTRQHGVVPAATTRAASVHAELAAGGAQELAHLIEQLGREGASTHAGGVRLLNTDHAGDAGRAHTRTDARAAGGRVGGGHERVGAVVNVQEGCLAALHQQGLTLVQRLVQQLGGVHNHRLQTLSVRHEVLDDFVDLNVAAVVDLHQQFVLLTQCALNLLTQNRLVQDVLNTHAEATNLIHVGGADTAAGGADSALAEETLGHLVHGLVVGCDQVCVSGNLQAGGVCTACLKAVNLSEQSFGVNNHAVTNHGDGVIAQNTRGQQLQLKLLAVHHHGVTGVVTAVGLDHVVYAGAEQVGCLTLTLIAPLGAHNHDS